MTGGDVTNATRLNPPSNVGWEITVEPDGDEAVTIVLPITTHCAPAGAICTEGEDRRMLSNSSIVTVPGPATQSQQAQVENSPATGLPTITGNATIGETLSVSMADVSDENGMTNASHSYQWMADGVNIQGATGPTHTLADGDEGTAIKVKVSFTDDDGFPESVTSAATAAVAAAPAAANTPATGSPTITGTAQVGQTLTADTSGIADADGLDNVSYGYQWIAGGSDIAGAARSSYTLAAADQGRAVKVTVSFTDDAGNDETLTSQATAAVAARPNTPATGQLTISGTSQVGETLTADTSGIADEDGLTGVSYIYEWTAGGANISGATGSSHTLTSSEQAQTVKVRVTFDDDAGNSETLTSAATASVRALTPFTAEFKNVPEHHDGAKAFKFELYFNKVAVTSWRTVVGGILDVSGGEVTGARRLDPDGADRNKRWEVTVEPAQAGGITITLPMRGYTQANAVCANEQPLARAVSATVIGETNNPATGAPTISGTAQVGETLTADADGLTSAAFAYQWIAGESDIGGATVSSYTLTSSEQGKTIKVRVTFTDDAGNGESLTSAATGAVAAAASPLTARTSQVPGSHDGNNSFTFELHFSEEFSLSYRTLRDYSFTVTGGEVVKARRLNPPSSVGWEITVQPDGDGTVTIVLPITTYCAPAGAICTEDRRMLSNRLELTVSGP